MMSVPLLLGTTSNKLPFTWQLLPGPVGLSIPHILKQLKVKAVIKAHVIRSTANCKLLKPNPTWKEWGTPTSTLSLEEQGNWASHASNPVSSSGKAQWQETALKQRKSDPDVTQIKCYCPTDQSSLWTPEPWHPFQVTKTIRDVSWSCLKLLGLKIPKYSPLQPIAKIHADPGSPNLLSFLLQWLIKHGQSLCNLLEPSTKANTLTGHLHRLPQQYWNFPYYWAS